MIAIGIPIVSIRRAIDNSQMDQYLDTLPSPDTRWRYTLQNFRIMSDFNYELGNRGCWHANHSVRRRLTARLVYR